MIKHLREQHLTGVDTDDEVGVALEIEMSRVVLLGAAGALAFCFSKVIDSKLLVHWAFFWPAIGCLLGAICFSWSALYLGTYVRHQRVKRKYTLYFGELNERLLAREENRSVNYDAYIPSRAAAYDLENRPRKLTTR